MLVAIIDNMAKDLATPNHLFIHRHTATAVRMFMDTATDPKSPLHAHLADYDLVQLGLLRESDDGTLAVEPAYEIILKGSAVKAQAEAAADPQLSLTK